MIQYIAVLDNDHLENALFLQSFASALAKHKERRGIILHGDSAYTERIIQGGVIREDAQIRAIKDLNHRLVALFADHGVSTIGLHGSQHGLLKKSGYELQLDQNELSRIHSRPYLLLSNLADDNGKEVPVPLTQLSQHLARQLKEFEIVLFSLKDRDAITGLSGETEIEWKDIKAQNIEECIPNAFRNFEFPVLLSTVSSFENWPNPEKSVKIT